MYIKIFILIDGRPMAHLMGLHLQIPRGAHTNAEQSGQDALSDHMISPSPFDADDGSHMHPDFTALTATKIINLSKVSINKNLNFPLQLVLNVLSFRFLVENV